MNITLYNEKSDTCREIFEFQLYSNVIKYVSYSISYRDNENDIWGDMWQEAHKKEIEEIQAKIDKIIDETYSCYSYGVSELQTELQNKYWPTCCKTIRGETRCSGQSGGTMPKYPWDEMGLKMLLVKEVRKIIAESKVY